MEELYRMPVRRFFWLHNRYMQLLKNCKQDQDLGDAD